MIQHNTGIKKSITPANFDGLKFFRHQSSDDESTIYKKIGGVHSRESEFEMVRGQTLINMSSSDTSIEALVDNINNDDQQFFIKKHYDFSNFNIEDSQPLLKDHQVYI